jgi:hypothetical protein
MRDPMEDIRDIYEKLTPELQEALLKYGLALLKHSNPGAGGVAAGEIESNIDDGGK